MGEEEHEGLADFRQHATTGLRESLGAQFQEFLDAHPTPADLALRAGSRLDPKVRVAARRGRACCRRRLTEHSRSAHVMGGCDGLRRGAVPGSVRPAVDFAAGRP
jgi:hypothetical protein